MTLVQTEPPLVLMGEGNNPSSSQNYSRASKEDGSSYKLPSPRRYISIRGGRENNLKGIDLDIPKGKFVVFTGVSGSGKSTLAFRIIGAEGVRLYLESLSIGSRTVLERIDRPKVDIIEGLSPTVSIEHKGTWKSPRSTVGTVTESYNFLRLLFAKAGRPFCFGCGREMKALTVSQMVDKIISVPDGSPIIIYSLLNGKDKEELRITFQDLKKMGFLKVKVGKETFELSEDLEIDSLVKKNLEILIDRLVKREGINQRLAESIEIGLGLSQGIVKVEFAEGREEIFTERLFCPYCMIIYPPAEPYLFSFNRPEGSCPHCFGLGELLVGTRRGGRKGEEEKETCKVCHGARLRKEALFFRLGGMNIYEISSLSVLEALHLFSRPFSETDTEIFHRILREIQDRLSFLEKIGLGYLTLSRSFNSLSLGEAQRVRLSRELSSNLSGVIYIVDEPTIGLHPQDNLLLINSLKALRDKGNTVIVVEHDPQTILSADFVVDMGPGAGKEGGEVIYHGSIRGLLDCSSSLTGNYLKEDAISIPSHPFFKGDSPLLKIIGAKTHNLKNITVEFPIGKLNCVTGLSGSGKSSLVVDTLLESLRRRLRGNLQWAKGVETIEGYHYIENVVEIDQSPVAGSNRSNPVTFTGVFEFIREIYALLPESKKRGYQKERFSYNLKGGRCEACQGEGLKKVGMFFLPDAYVTCDQCHGRRYNRETLEITFKGLSIADVLDMTVKEGLKFWNHLHPIKDRLLPMFEVGLGYLRLGEPLHTLSAGESQRLKIAKELARKERGNNLYILDEPTKGLHFSEIEKLLKILTTLRDKGNTIILVEHNLEVILAADFVVDMGPGAGDKGGRVVACGNPKEIAENKDSYTGRFLKEIIQKKGYRFS